MCVIYCWALDPLLRAICTCSETPWRKLFFCLLAVINGRYILVLGGGLVKSFSCLVLNDHLGAENCNNDILLCFLTASIKSLTDSMFCSNQHFLFRYLLFLRCSKYSCLLFPVWTNQYLRSSKVSVLPIFP